SRRMEPMSRLAFSGVLVACVLAIAGCKKKAKFQEFTSEEGRFKVSMPGKPKEKVQPSGLFQLKTYSVDEKDGAYVVCFSDLPIAANEPDAMVQHRLDEMRDAWLHSENARLKKETNITLSNRYPGREIEAELPNPPGLFHMRIWLANKRFYLIAVAGKHSWFSSADPTKFLDSLTLTE